MNTEADFQVAFQREIKGLFNAKNEANDIVKAFEAFMLAFIQLKAKNEQEAADRTGEFKAALKEINDKFDSGQKKIDKAIAAIKNGKSPVAGIDYPSRAQFVTMLESMRPKMPQLGVDYFIPTKEEIVAACMEMLQPTDVYKMLFNAPDNVISAVNGGNIQIDADRVEGLTQLIAEVRKKHFPPFWAGTGQANPSTSSVGAWKTPAESPDSSTTTFTTTGVVTDVIADGIVMFDGAGYTLGVNQIVFTNPPTQYVRYR